MKHTILALFALAAITACDQPADDFDPALDCPSLDDLEYEAQIADKYGDAEIMIMNTGYGPLVSRNPDLAAATCSVTESDPFIVTCHFAACDMTMETEVSHPSGEGTYKLTMINPCG